MNLQQFANAFAHNSAVGTDALELTFILERAMILRTLLGYQRGSKIVMSTKAMHLSIIVSPDTVYVGDAVGRSRVETIRIYDSSELAMLHNDRLICWYQALTAPDLLNELAYRIWELSYLL